MFEAFFKSRFLISLAFESFDAEKDARKLKDVEEGEGTSAMDYRLRIRHKGVGYYRPKNNASRDCKSVFEGEFHINVRYALEARAKNVSTITR